MRAEVIQVIRTDLMRRGDSASNLDPVRLVEQFWSLEGELLAENDPDRQRTLETIMGEVEELLAAIGNHSTDMTDWPAVVVSAGSLEATLKAAKWAS